MGGMLQNISHNISIQAYDWNVESFLISHEFVVESFAPVRFQRKMPHPLQVVCGDHAGYFRR